jgi:uncharacterized protein YndB with AHSA1/START domain
MGPLSAKRTIDAPRERVWGLVCDLALRPSFCDHFMREFRLQRVDSAGPGAAARFHLDAPRFSYWMETVITEADEPYMLLERGKGARIDRMPVGTAWELVPSGGTMTEVTVTFWTEPSHPLDKLKDRLSSGRWYERQFGRALNRLAEIAEGEAAVEPLRVAGASRP